MIYVTYPAPYHTARGFTPGHSTDTLPVTRTIVLDHTPCQDERWLTNNIANMPTPGDSDKVTWLLVTVKMLVGLF